MSTRQCIFQQVHFSAYITWRFCAFKGKDLSLSVTPESAPCSVQDVLSYPLLSFLHIFKNIWVSLSPLRYTSKCFLLELTYIFHYSESHVLSCVNIVFCTTNIFIPGFSVYFLASFSASLFSLIIYSLCSDFVWRYFK